MRVTWPRAVFAVLLGIGVLAGGFGLSGLAPLAASDGHWGITNAILDFGMEQVVRTQSRWVPDEAPGGLSLVESAGHYETACRFCHGAPGEAPVPGLMTPSPPDLAHAVQEWSDEELFWIVKHGVKFTGMPGWLSQQRDDEVWSMVAFLRRYPDLDEEGYERLVFGGTGDEALDGCARCHGEDGLGRDDGIPRLAGQSAEYLAGSLEAYATGQRHSAVMQAFARGIGAEGRRRIARRYAEMDPGGPAPVPADAVARGRRIAERGVPERRVGSCADCHGPSPIERNPHYPRLAGQHAAYLEEQLELLQHGRRGGTPWVELMDTVLGHRLEPAEIHDVAAFYASLPPERAPAGDGAAGP